MVEQIQQTRSVQLPDLYDKQYRAFFGEPRSIYVEGSTKSGKAQPLDATVYTPHGPKPMADIKKNSKVLVPGGDVARVIGEYPQGVCDVYEITFSDGSTTRATADHWWHTHSYRHDGPGRLYTTEQLAEMSPEKMWVPPCGEVAFQPQDTPIDPYVMGILLAEGGFRNNNLRVSTGDEFVINEVRRHLPDSMEAIEYEDDPDYRLVDQSGHSNEWLSILRRMGLQGCYSHEKFIPDRYKYNDAATRYCLLQGIFDGDGWLNERGHIRLGQTSEQLAHDVQEVLESLGGEARIRTKESNERRDVYRLSVKFDQPSKMLRLPRKKQQAKPMERKVRRKFRSIEKVGEAECKCIKIDHPSSLYLTDHFIATHNTHAGLTWILWQAFEAEPGRAFWWVAPIAQQAIMARDRIDEWLPDDDDLYTLNKSENYIDIHEAGRIWFKSGERPDTLYGEDVYGVVLDEATRCDRDVYEAVRSTLTATNGKLRAIANVRGRDNWHYEKCRKAERGDLQDARYVQMDIFDAIEAPDDLIPITQEDWEQAQEDYEHNPQKLRELYLCEPQDVGGNPFGQEAINDICWESGFDAGPPVGWAWDLARTGDYTVGLAINDSGFLCDGRRFQKPWPETQQDILRICQGKPIIVDSTGAGGPVVQELRHDRASPTLAYHFSPKSKQKLYDHLRQAIQKAEIGGVPKRSPLEHELRSFQFSRTDAGMRYEAPEGKSDDCVDALALVWHLYRQVRAQHDRKRRASEQGAITSSGGHVDPFE